ncbi:MAG: hypothetical protein JRC68_01305 [Deltaproteobacteria bacterium]|nr:hypothetical protein [Deltaproteobacteria bacterium]
MSKKEKITGQRINATADKEQEYITFSLSKEEDEIGILTIKELIDKTTNMVFLSHKERLLSEPITYIVPAVWGKKKHGKLTINQQEIHNNIAPMISNIMKIFKFKEINEAQRFTIEYLIRGLVISKITYMVEAFKNRPIDEIQSGEGNADLLDSLEILGNA